MLKKNDELIAIVNSIGNNCEGIIKGEDYTIFVPFCLPEEKVKIKILKVDKKIAYAKLLEVIVASPYRVNCECPVYTKCGGCQLQHSNYKNQLEIKKQTIIDAFSKIAFMKIIPNSIVCSDNIFRYRNKLQVPVAQVEDKILIGFYAENSHRVVPITDCLINPEWTSSLITALKDFMVDYSLKGYDSTKNIGDIREITAREINGNIIITLVTIKDNLPQIYKFVDYLKKNISNNFSLFQNVNSSSTNVIYGDKFKLIYGVGTYESNMLTINHKMGVRSFMQVNSEVCEKLYCAVKNSIDFSKYTNIIDAYSGAGLMTALLAVQAEKVYGIEIIPEAVDLANQLAKDNGLDNKITNLLGKCEDLLPPLVEKESKNGNFCVVLDPPRKGCDIKVLKALLISNVSRIVYISCKPQTLARDVGILCGFLQEVDGKIVKSNGQNGVYEVESITPFDMFPQTKHIETLVVLNKK